MTDNAPILEVKALQVRYGEIRALRGIDVTVGRGEIVTLIGANGAGKSTLMRAVSRLIPAAGGSIVYRPEPGREIDVAAREAHALPRMGLCQVPEGRGVFANLTVRENLAMGAYFQHDAAVVAKRMEHGFALFPRLKERLHQAAGTLSGGEQQMLAIARALMAGPKLLLLDEPSLGLAPLLVQTIFAAIRTINAEGVTVLLVEQNANQALKVSHRAYVLETGEIVLAGPSSELAGNEQVKKAYLGH
jgi:branched-chain amino acid transport system ATP-binding protein